MNKLKGTVKYDRFVIPYRVYGKGKKTLVCVNGAQQTMAAWRSVVSRFRHNYSVVTFDLPGHGKSEILSAPITVSLDEQVACLKEIIQATHSNDTLHIIGASWGTIVVAAYAARYPEVPDKLILGSFGVKPSSAMLQVIRQGRWLYEADRGPEAAHLIIECFGQQISDGHKDRIVNQFKEMRAEQQLCFYEHCEFVENIGHIDELVELGRIKARTLIINGGNDTILNIQDLEQAAVAIPWCESHIVEDAGHFLHFEQPDILQIYEAFFADLPNTSDRLAPPSERDLGRFSVSRPLKPERRSVREGLLASDPAL